MIELNDVKIYVDKDGNYSLIKTAVNKEESRDNLIHWTGLYAFPSEQHAAIFKRAIKAINHHGYIYMRTIPDSKESCILLLINTSVIGNGISDVMDYRKT